MTQYAVAILLALTTATPASARNIVNWQCGDVGVDQSVNKNTTPYSRDIQITGCKPDNVAVHFKVTSATIGGGQGKAYLNGKRCREIPYDPKRA